MNESHILAPVAGGLCVILTGTFTADQMVNDLAITLACDFDLPIVEQFDIVIKDDLHGLVHTACAIRQALLGTLGNLGTASRQAALATCAPLWGAQVSLSQSYSDTIVMLHSSH